MIIRLLSGCVLLPPLATAQDFSLGLAGADRALDDGIITADLRSLLDPTMGGRLKGVAGYSLSASVAYDSNVNLASRGAEEDDVSFSISPAAFYSTDPVGGARYVVEAYYGPSYQTYLSNNDFGRLNHRGGATFTMRGSRTSISSFINLAQSSGPDRLIESYSESTIYSGGASVSYELAPRTSIYGALSTAGSLYQTDERGAESYSARLGAFWSATERIGIGPSVRYTRTESRLVGTRSALGGLFNVRYFATEKTNLSGSIGAESVENSRTGGSGDVKLTGGLQLSYAINEVWTSQASIRYANIPSPTFANYVINDLTLQVGVSRAMLRGGLNAGASYSLSDYERVGPTEAPRGNDENLSIFLSYSRPVFSDRIGLGTSVTYSTNSGGRDWSRWLVSAGLSVAF
jgi:hypothetical protein